MTNFLNKHNELLTWVFRLIVGLMLVAQLWLTSNFVTKESFEKYKLDVDTLLRASTPRSELTAPLTELAGHNVRISNLERFERDSLRRTSDFEASMDAIRRDMAENTKQSAASATLLNAYREDLRDVSKKMDMVLQLLAAQPRSPSER